ncbi:hypothetical protein RPMA_07710 [Tardiphaga alba]|uniref:Uncharacterized protein n=2 Tax=Tardiphaga alba TaxID=340268 RepID=A0ABX8AHA0_9BRAD|nr:hypothetical protein RPMA_07710 [Tardiphaga alba]
MSRKGLGLLVVCLMALCQPLPSRAAGPLITPEEAALPPPKGAVGVDRRGVTRGPKIELVSGSDIASLPTRFQLKFQTFGGATVDLASVKVLYLRTPNVDLTERLKTFLQPAGIDMPDASLPPGEHMLRVDLKDSDGRAGSTSFILKVAR